MHWVSLALITFACVLDGKATEVAFGNAAGGMRLVVAFGDAAGERVRDAEPKGVHYITP